MQLHWQSIHSLQQLLSLLSLLSSPLSLRSLTLVVDWWTGGLGVLMVVRVRSKEQGRGQRWRGLGDQGGRGCAVLCKAVRCDVQRAVHVMGQDDVQRASLQWTSGSGNTVQDRAAAA